MIISDWNGYVLTINKSLNNEYTYPHSINKLYVDLYIYITNKIKEC